MHLYSFSPDIQTMLLNQPETGMGYQIVEFKKPYEYTTTRMVVLNSEMGFPSSEMGDFRNQFQGTSYRSIKAKAEFVNLSFHRVLSRREWHSIVNERTDWPQTPAKDSVATRCNGTERFVRLSAYEDDKRVDKVNKRFRPGTYATTEDDYILCVNSKDDPVERYALPNDEIIQYAFYVKPTTNDFVKRGTVEPDFGKRGGGKEVLFPDGTSNGTYQGMTNYGNFM